VHELEVQKSGGNTVASRVTFPAGEPDWFERDLGLHDGVAGWGRDRGGIVVVTRSWDPTRPLRLPEDLIASMVRAGAVAELAERQ
jgi:hypothetical protein